MLWQAVEVVRWTTKLSNPANLPTGYGRDCSFSPDSNYLAVAHVNSPYITIYKRNGDTFKLPNPGVLPTNSSSFSPDNNYLAVAHGTSPFITIYKRNGDRFTKLSNPDDLPTSGGFGCSFSPDSNYLAVTNLSLTPYNLQTQWRYLYLPNPDVLPTNGRGCSFSPDSNYLAVAQTLHT